jgi:trimethyllysine dioxygenase
MLACRATGLAVTWDDGTTSEYPWLWVRDHAHDPATLHPDTHQRQLYTAGVPESIRGVAAVAEGDQVVVTWSDPAQPPTRLPLPFLARFRAPWTDGAAAARIAGLGSAPEPVLWDQAGIDAAVPAVHHDALMAGDAGVRDCLHEIVRYGFCVVQGTPVSTTATEAVIRRIGYVRETIFGGMWEFEANLAKADTAYTNLELLPHTDGTYSHDAPGLQALHCLAFAGEGGESTLVDGLRIAAELAADAPVDYATLCRVEVPGQYVGDGVHLMAARPVFRLSAAGQVVQVSFNNADRAPFLLPAEEMTAFYGALRAFEQLANDRRLQWRHVLRPGQVLLFDNWRVLHGRGAYSGHRRLCGGYVNREDVESRLRVLG